MEHVFTIITIVRNCLPELKRTFLSLKDQKNQSFEWIVIDAASTDGTVEWLESVSDFKDRFFWLSEPDDGISDAWNKGISLAKGKQVLLLNAGDTYDSDLLACFAEHVDDSKITCCHARKLSEKGDYLGVFEACPSKLWRGMHIPHNWCSVPLKFYTEFGLYSKIPHSMDFEWFHRFFKQKGSEGFYVINQTLGDFRGGGHSEVFYSDAFKANEVILKNSGMSPALALLVRLTYVFKHKAMLFVSKF